MKALRYLILGVAMVLNTALNAQWVSIPDTTFGYLLSIKYPQCMNYQAGSGWQMDTGCPAIVNEQSFSTNGFIIHDLTGIEHFVNLKTLDCSSAGLTQLPTLPPGLSSLTCSNQPSSSGGLPFVVNTIPATLTYFECPQNNWTTLPPLPAGLVNLYCDNNLLTTLPPLPAGLKKLYCSSNNLTTIPTLPNGLTALKCAWNPLTTPLPTLPSTLDYLYCSANNLTTLPALPSGLYFLDCRDNQLSALPALPAGLQTLSCSNNNLTSLSATPLPALKYLYCNNNQLTSLPVLPLNSMFTLQCKNNQISSLSVVPSAGEFAIDSNPISCLPKLGTIIKFTFTGTNINCLPNYPLNNTSSNPPLASTPLCGVPNSNGCQVYANISGTVYTDSNNNCLYEVTEPNLKGIPVQLWSNGTPVQQSMVFATGIYSFDTDTLGTYQLTIDTANIPFQTQCPVSGTHVSVLSLADSIDADINFAIECKLGYDLVAKSIVAPTVFRPAVYTTTEISTGDAANFYNAKCVSGVSGGVSLSFTGPVKYIAPADSALIPSVTGNTLTWNIADFGTVNFFEDFDVVMQADTFAQIGQQICFTLSVTPTSGDNNPANNTLTHCFTIVNSFDPNDKTVYPAGNIDTAQRDLVYTIRFQNTGNAEAQHIYITDTLSSSINPASFQLLAYSHQPMVQLDGNKLRFNFPNINLPDSTTNEPASHGYVQYKVKLKENLPIGTTINNTAFIYFDFNAPVITNTTTNTVSIEVDTTVGIRHIKTDAQVFVYPNPANNVVTVTLSENMPNSIITITDVLGRTALQPVTLSNTRSITFTTQQLPDGVYLVNVKSPQGAQVTKRLLVNR